MNNYFLTLVLKADQTESTRKELLDSIEKKLKTENSTLKTNLWGSRDLAYPIKHLSKGYYAHFEFSADPTLAKDLDKMLRVEEDIIRFLLVRDDGKIRKVKETKEVKEEPKVEIEKKVLRKKIIIKGK